MYTLDDRIVVNFVGRYEQFARDMKAVCCEVGLPFSDLPIVKQSATQYDYKYFYTEGDRRLVEEIFGREIEQFRYKYR